MKTWIIVTALVLVALYLSYRDDEEQTGGMVRDDTPPTLEKRLADLGRWIRQASSTPVRRVVQLSPAQTPCPTDGTIGCMVGSSPSATDSGLTGTAAKGLVLA